MSETASPPDESAPPGSASQPRGRADPRVVAARVLDQVLSRAVPLDEALGQVPGWEDLQPSDRGFGRLMTSTTLRRLGQIDWLIDYICKRPPPKKARFVRHVLRLGVVQLVFLGTPPHAAVATSVELCGYFRHAKYKGLVNAVLRRVDREGSTLLAQRDVYQLNLPAWLRASWEAAYGEEAARASLEVIIQEAALDMTMPSLDSARHYADVLDSRIMPLGERTPTLRRRVADKDQTSRVRVEDLPGFADGIWWVQDAAAALPARLAGDLSGCRVIDLCAAPGGKTAQLAALGAREVVAADKNPARLTRLAGNMARLGLAERVQTQPCDGERWQPETPADLVLVDAPCTGTGTLRRHPEIAHLKSRRDVELMLDVQARLLANAATMVRPGGWLIYCTCSLEPEEGEEQIARFLAGRPDFVRAPVTPADLGGFTEAITEAGDLRTLPCHKAGLGGMDGFFAARLRRLPSRMDAPPGSDAAS